MIWFALKKVEILGCLHLLWCGFIVEFCCFARFCNNDNLTLSTWFVFSVFSVFRAVAVKSWSVVLCPLCREDFAWNNEGRRTRWAFDCLFFFLLNYSEAMRATEGQLFFVQVTFLCFLSLYVCTSSFLPLVSVLSALLSLLPPPSHLTLFDKCCF